MAGFFRLWRWVLSEMLLFPWPQSKMPQRDTVLDREYFRSTHILIWWMWWVLSFSGIIAAGFYAPYLTNQYLIHQWPSLYQYEDYFVIGLAFLGGILWQAIGVFIFTISVINTKDTKEVKLISEIALLSNFVVPPGLSGWLIYWYITHFAPHHNLTGTGIIGATLLKVILAFLPGIIKSIMTSTFFTWLIKAIRGKRPPINPAT